MPRAIEMMKRREEELLKTVQHVSNKTDGFKNPKLILVGGYALRAFIPFSRFTRDGDFTVRKKDGWSLDELKAIMPEGYSIEKEEKHENYGFMRWIKYLEYNKVRAKVSIDFMEGEIRGRKDEEIILIDEEMVNNSRFVSITIAEERVSVAVPSYLDYLIMKVVSSRASDIRDVASLIHEKGIPTGLKERVKEILPYPRIFQLKIEQRIIPELRKVTFSDSWKGIFATTKYTESDKEKIIEQLSKVVVE
ncbi:MAG: nucleotidyl transferase AbiEii/AbiGii toxin family protein [Nitrososphaerales archaeon]